MLDCTELTKSKLYIISGKPGQWHYSYSVDEARSKRYVFWRFAAKNPNRRVTLSLSQEQTRRDVWEQRQDIQLTNLEAFRGL
ncbi:hypothetical protein F7734_52160 [Scytonema sp. UIC 10036]|uniref:hypothetical protein n=1 Tax=Scytonema sp. UIC 10036 TaxID=2304196 RepID=UPI0012DAD5EF|nr:hypothetical protein [Scytonema sp. UIC 10036]MUH00378.1 hypothetical protein [Scytonema sp. UIC 10036]